jgi:hypothetical protein
MNTKNTNTTSTKKKDKSKYHEKVVIHASYEEVLSSLLNTPPLKKRGKKSSLENE